MRQLTLKSPAKVNLYLRLLKKRKDGYNEIFTLFHKISLFDTLELRKTATPGIKIVCSNKSLVKDNIIYKAYDLLCKKSGIGGGVRVKLKKRIPLEAGLGGGSSDAASFIKGMQRLFNIKLKSNDLNKLGLKIGSDVPFFMSDASQAIGRGRGENLKKIPVKARLWFVITCFDKGISTGKAYKSFIYPSKRQIGLTKVSRDVTMLSAYLNNKNIPQISNLLYNDLTKTSILLKPAIKPVLTFIKDIAPATMMSGSGPSVFSIVKSRKEAERLSRKIRRHLCLKTFVCQTY